MSSRQGRRRRQAWMSFCLFSTVLGRQQSNTDNRTKTFLKNPYKALQRRLRKGFYLSALELKDNRILRFLWVDNTARKVKISSITNKVLKGSHHTSRFLDPVEFSYEEGMEKWQTLTEDSLVYDDFAIITNAIRVFHESKTFFKIMTT